MLAFLAINGKELMWQAEQRVRVASRQDGAG